MKIALLISGYLRTYKINLPKIEALIVNNFKTADIYMHITKDEQDQDKYFNPSDINEDIRFIESKLNPQCLLIEDNLLLGAHSNLHNTWIKYYKLNTIKKINENSTGKYDLVIKYRPDLDLLSTNIFDVDHSPHTIHIPSDSKIDKSKLRAKGDKYICDIFAFGSSESMDKYFDIFGKLDDIVERNGSVPETVLYHYLEEEGIKYVLKDIDYQVLLSQCSVFGICGDSGAGKTTLGMVLKEFFSNSFILEGDRYHKWERGDDNWDKFTHLNPDANYIAKMSEDIFNLKIGNSIYQVDYDHNNGTFTEDQLIECPQNTIVCGLHSLYDEGEDLYDLKIYVDTHPELKEEWKIKRDVEKRGHTRDTVLQSIESRRSDYQQYILPQRAKSDLIVRFHPESGGIGLSLGVSGRYEIESILKTFKEKKVKHTVCHEEGDFTTVTFRKYKNVSLWKNSNSPHFGDFYDYVVYFILNLPNNRRVKSEKTI